MLLRHDWDFCQRLDCSDLESLSNLQDRFFALQWLQQFKGDVHRMLAMRTVLSQEGNAWSLCRMSDDSVVDRIAELLASRRLHVHMQPARAPVGGSGPSQYSTLSTASTAEPFVPFPLSERRPRSPSASSRQPVVDPPTFSSDVDSAAQAATLVAAAASGAAMCYI